MGYLRDRLGALACLTPHICVPPLVIIAILWMSALAPITSPDWTLGCVALDDPAMKEPFEALPVGAAVVIQP
jgi:hypothetical protein